MLPCKQPFCQMKSLNETETLILFFNVSCYVSKGNHYVLICIHMYRLPSTRSHKRTTLFSSINFSTDISECRLLQL